MEQGFSTGKFDAERAALKSRPFGKSELGVIVFGVETAFKADHQAAGFRIVAAQTTVFADGHSGTRNGFPD